MRRWTGVVAVLLCAVACSSDPAGPAVAEESLDPLPTVREAADPVPGIEGEAVQLRTDVAAGGRIQVRISASDTFTVTSVALDSPGFAPQPPREISTDFVPGQVTDLRTPIGRAQCDVEPQPASARLTVARDGAEPEPVEVPLAADVLDRIHAAECAAQSLAQEVTVEVTGLRAVPEGLSGSLALVRRSGDREARVTRILRSVLVAVEADLPLTMAGDDSEAATDVRLAPATCDPHVLAETKQPFRFPVTVQVGEATPVTVDLPIPDDVRAQLQEMVQRICG
jgi:hypothetical protein